MGAGRRVNPTLALMNCPGCHESIAVIFAECPRCGIRTCDHDRPIVAALDTNVFLDIHSAHDLIRGHDALHAELGDSAIDDRRVIYRVVRARESLLLGIHLHRIVASTYSLHSELLAQLKRAAPPDAAPEDALPTDFTTVFIYFVKDYLLGGWSPKMATAPANEKSNEADRAILGYARDAGIPLITNEGFTPNGIDDVKLRKLARAQGVPVFTPGEYFRPSLDESAVVLPRFCGHQRRPAMSWPGGVHGNEEEGTTALRARVQGGGRRAGAEEREDGRAGRA